MRQALLVLCIGILVLYCILVYVICRCFMGSYYVSEIETELVSAYDTICESPEADWELISELEKNNLSLLVFRKDTEELLYNSKYPHDAMNEIVDAMRISLIERLSQTDEPYFIDTMDETQRTFTGAEQYYGSTIFLGGDTGVYYVQISTQKEPIEKSMDIAIQFMVWAGVLVMFLASIVVMVLAEWMSKPVHEMTTVSRQIADHDFSQRCDGGTITEMHDLAGSINLISDQMQDYIRELEEANAQLKADLEKVEKSELARKSLVSNISHDLKTPIALISGYADGLRAGMAKTDEQVREYCDVISDETDRMMDMICEMLEVSRLESGTVQLNMDDFDLIEELDGILSSFRMEIERRGITLSRDYPESAYIYSDAVCVEQVLMNYIQNAVSHMGEGRQMRVTVTGREIRRVTIYNSSPPIPDEDLERIWDTFYRGEKSRTRASHQSGLGLAIVRGNMELLDMQYGVRNVAGGVEFWAEFPASEFEF